MTVRLSWARALLAGVLLPGVAGCSHALEIVNEAELVAKPVHDDSQRGLRVALLAYCTSAGSETNANEFASCEREFLSEIARSLCEQAGYQAFVMAPSPSQPVVDFVVQLTERMSGEGRGSNLPIGFPGCILYIPAWRGFGFDVDWQCRIGVFDGGQKRQLAGKDLVRKMDIRYTSGSRGLAAASWWLVPFGTISAIMAPCQLGSDYDTTATLQLRESGRLKMLAEGVAGEIVVQINEALRKRRQEERERDAKRSVDPMRQLRDSGVITEDEYQAETLRTGGRDER